ncbi:hypothetical protein Bmyc01_45910 [Bacillus mycoides]|nr:hypothetical protein Bmyc01_45910 [Bacillus mycoides]
MRGLLLRFECKIPKEISTSTQSKDKHILYYEKLPCSSNNKQHFVNETY